MEHSPRAKLEEASFGGGHHDHAGRRRRLRPPSRPHSHRRPAGSEARQFLGARSKACELALGLRPHRASQHRALALSAAGAGSASRSAEVDGASSSLSASARSSAGRSEQTASGSASSVTRASSSASFTVPVLTLSPARRRTETSFGTRRKCSTETPATPWLTAHAARASGTYSAWITSRAGYP